MIPSSCTDETFEEGGKWRKDTFEIEIHPGRHQKIGSFYIEESHGKEQVHAAVHFQVHQFTDFHIVLLSLVKNVTI